MLSAARIGILSANATVDLPGFARQIRLVQSKVEVNTATLLTPAALGKEGAAEKALLPEPYHQSSGGAHRDRKRYRSRPLSRRQV
jgi:hypothetical protein